MNWWDIIKGRYLSKKRMEFAKDCVEEIEGLIVDEFAHSKAGHLVAKCVYTGDDLPPGKTEVRFNNTINLKKMGRNRATCSGIKARCRKELAKQQVFIGDW